MGVLLTALAISAPSTAFRRTISLRHLYQHDRPSRLFGHGPLSGVLKVYQAAEALTDLIAIREITDCCDRGICIRLEEGQHARSEYLTRPRRRLVQGALR